MTREEQIIKASVNYNVAKGKLNVIGGDAILSDEEFITFNRNPQFIDGAIWSDKNPPESFKEALRMEYERGKNEGYHELIDKACKWLEEYIETDNDEFDVDFNAMIYDFRKAMEE